MLRKQKISIKPDISSANGSSYLINNIFTNPFYFIHQFDILAYMCLSSDLTCYSFKILRELTSHYRIKNSTHAFFNFCP